MLEEGITPVTLRQKRAQGVAPSIDELVLVYGRHSQEYYRKNGGVTREGELRVPSQTVLFWWQWDWRSRCYKRFFRVKRNVEFKSSGRPIFLIGITPRERESVWDAESSCQ